MVRFEKFGDPMQFCEPSWYQGFETPYFNQTHVEFRNRLRKFVKRIKKKERKWLPTETYPRELHEEFARLGFSGVLFPKEYGGVGGTDYFHEQILWDEMQSLTGGLIYGPLAITSMALPPILMGASRKLKDRVVREVVAGREFVGLMISEPGYGSDVAGIETTAIKDGDHYVVNGNKKWITNGLWADWFTTAVRTGGPGMRGLSLLLIHKDTPGIKIRKMPTQAGGFCPSCFVSLNNVRVPRENLLGKEGMGFMYIVVNFNHERWIIAVQACRNARICFSESLKYGMKRKTFGKRLVDHQAIRLKLAEMARQIESLQDSIEKVTLQFNAKTDAKIMGGQCALLKVNASRCFEFCAREASQIFGGSAIVQEGAGATIERLYRSVRTAAIPGGSEEILLDFSMRQIIGASKKKKKGKL